MVVLAASIITRSGKAILSRQFRDLTKNRVTELLANFPGLLSDKNTQHTTVEDEHVRYVYQPLDDLYIILITNRQSNILQDIDTLHLFSEVVTSLLRTINEHEIFENAFEILSAFDEIITLGYKENLSLLQIRTFLEMDSHEEKIHEIIERNKELEATEERKRRAKEIQRKELARRNMDSAFPSSISNNFSVGADKYDSLSEPQNQIPTLVPGPTDYSSSSSKTKQAPRGRGLQLGKKKSNRLGAGDPSSEPLISTPEPRYSEQSSSQDASQHQSQRAVPAPQDDKPINNGILVTVEEKVSAEITREGSILSSELKGVLQLRINDAELAQAKILLENEGTSHGIQFKTHPNVDKTLFSNEAIIGLKNPSKPFPSNDQNLGVLRWRGVGKADETKFIPIQFSAWLSANGNVVDVTLEFEVTEDYNESINNITILVPVPTEDVEIKSDNATISAITEEGIFFHIDNLSPGQNGVLEFSIDANEDALFPIEVSFTNENPVNTLGKIKVLDVVTTESGESLPFDLLSELSSEGYFIV